MSKITVKHFLNENLKPYNIGGDNYYSVYVLVTAKRQNTKFKSLALNEYYSKQNFEDIINSNDEDDILLIKNETNTIQIISELVIDILQSFDTAFLSAFFNFSNEIYLFNPDIEVLNYEDLNINFYRKDKNKAGIDLGSIFCEFTDHILADGVSIYNFYNYQNQLKFKNLLLENNCKVNVDEFIKDINKLLFIGTFEKFHYYLLGSKKNKILINKYSFFFEQVSSLSIILGKDFMLKYSV